MENDQVFEADASIDARASRTLPPSYRENERERDSGSEFATTRYAAIEAQKNPEYEETPLLAGGADGVYSAATPPDHDNGRGAPSWFGERDFEGKSGWHKPSIFWLLPPFLLFTLAFGGIIVPRLNLILTLVCKEYLSDRAAGDPTLQLTPVIMGNDNPQCRIPEVQSLVSKFTLYGSLITGILSAITGAKLGELSDRYGRTKILSFMSCGSLFLEVIFIIAAANPETVNYRWLLLGYALDGLFGSFTAAMAVTNAYASDCTPPAKRNVVFGYFHGCLFSGIALGPILAGYIVEYTGKILSIFYIALGCQLAFILFVLFVVPDSLSKKRQKAAQNKAKYLGNAGEFRYGVGTDNAVGIMWHTGFVLAKTGSIFKPLKILYPTGEGSSRAVRRNLVFLAAVDTTMFGVAMGSMTIVVIYSNYMFGWGNFESSVFVSIVNICRVICLLVVLPTITRLVRGPSGSYPTRNSGSDELDLGIIRTAIVFDMMGYIGFATVRTGNLLILSGAIAAIGGMGSPTLQSALTKHVPPERTGQLLGAIGLLHALTRVVAPTTFNMIYSLTVGKFTQTVFVCLASTFGVAFVLSWFIKPHVYFDEQETPIVPDNDQSDEGDART